MNTIRTGEKIDCNGYTITRIGAGKEGSKSDWALFCVEVNDQKDTCVRAWVKVGHSLAVGDKDYTLTASDRESSTLETSKSSCS